MGITSWYVTSQSRYLSLLSSTGPEMSASQGAVAGKVTVGLVLHWPGITEYIHLHAQWPKEGK